MSGKLGIWSHIPHLCFPKKDYCFALPIVYDIVMAMSERDFRVPGVTVNFSLNIYGDKTYKQLSQIEYNDLDISLSFCYIQGRLEDNLNDIAGLHECHIKGYSAKFNDYGNCYFMYTGNNWEAARTDFRTMLYKDQ